MNIPNKIIVTLLCLFISIASFGKEKTRVVIKDCKSGQLEELIKEKGYDAFKIERLTVKGEIELRDVLFIRSLEQLKVLDLANVTIIDDIKSEPPETISRANTLSFRLFMIDGLPAGEMVPKKLERIVLPKNLEELSEGVFSGYKERYALLAGEIRLPRTLKRIDIEVFAYTKISYKLPLPISLAYIGSARILAKGTLQLPLNLTYLNVAEFECPNIEAFALPDENPDRKSVV